MENKILGLHHITAIAGDAKRNFDFYSKILGLRFIKKTVNFDDPGTYHFYFGDEVGSAGTILTFFPWGSGIAQGRRGSGMATEIETARLLLLSASPFHPAGLGNHSGHLGRHVQGHYYPIAYGLLPRGVENPNRGPGVNIATTRFNHGNPDVIGGAMLANDFVKLPIIFWRSSLPPDVPRWGLANKRAMRELYLRGIDLRGPVQEIPSPDSRVTLDPHLAPDAAHHTVVDQEGRSLYAHVLASVEGLFHPAAEALDHHALGIGSQGDGQAVLGRKPRVPFHTVL